MNSTPLNFRKLFRIYASQTFTEIVFDFTIGASVVILLWFLASKLLD